MSSEGANFMGALVKAGYFMPILGVIMILTGLSLVFRKHTALMLVIMAPITVNIILFHLFLDPGNIMVAAVLTIVHVIMLWAYKDCYKGMLSCCGKGKC